MERKLSLLVYLYLMLERFQTKPLMKQTDLFIVMLPCALNPVL